jgi:pyruvate dehydrogenase E2 component (dihydrolipoyllysine-residue acetyltransferase)
MTEESTIVEWRKQVGDKVAKGDILFTVETDKSVMEVESFEDGTLLKIVVGPGVSVPVQSTVGFIGSPGEAIPGTNVSPLSSAGGSVAGPQPSATTPPESTRPTMEPNPVRISPRAARLAGEHAIDLSKIAGTGPDGRITEKDVRNFIEAQRDDPAATEEPRPMSKMRQIIAQRLQQSVVTAPHFFVTVEVDMTDLIAFRAQLKEQGAPFTITDFISQAVVLTLKEFPDVNSSTDGKTIRPHSHVHLGLAVSLEEGLVVPVIRNADGLTLADLNVRSRELGEKARAGKLTPDEMSGGTFTISNMGMLDVENFTAIINPGESAILAVSSTLKKPVVCKDKVIVRQIMKMTLSSDHRIIDGALAARFVNAVRTKLEDLELWKRLAA